MVMLKIFSVNKSKIYILTLNLRKILLINLQAKMTYSLTSSSVQS